MTADDINRIRERRTTPNNMKIPTEGPYDDFVTLLAALDDRDTRIAAIREMADGLIHSFREHESNRKLYDVATHRWVDLLAAVLRDQEATDG